MEKIYKINDIIVSNDRKYYFQFYARYGGKDHIIVAENPSNTVEYNKYLSLTNCIK